MRSFQRRALLGAGLGLAGSGLLTDCAHPHPATGTPAPGPGPASGSGSGSGSDDGYVSPDGPQVAEAERRRHGGPVRTVRLTATESTIDLGGPTVRTWTFGGRAARRQRPGHGRRHPGGGRRQPPPRADHRALARRLHPQRHGRRPRRHPAPDRARRRLHLPLHPPAPRHVLVPSAHRPPAGPRAVRAAHRRRPAGNRCRTTASGSSYWTTGSTGWTGPRRTACWRSCPAGGGQGARPSGDGDTATQALRRHDHSGTAIADVPLRRPTPGPVGPSRRLTDGSTARCSAATRATSTYPYYLINGRGTDRPRDLHRAGRASGSAADHQRRRRHRLPGRAGRPSDDGSPTPTATGRPRRRRRAAAGHGRAVRRAGHRRRRRRSRWSRWPRARTPRAGRAAYLAVGRRAERVLGPRELDGTLLTADRLRADPRSCPPTAIRTTSSPCVQ